MKIIEFSEAKKSIESHLESSLKLVQSLHETDDERSVITFLNDVETHLDIAWYLLDRYMNDELVTRIVDIYRTKLHIGYYMKDLKDRNKGYAKSNIEALSFEIETQLNHIKD